MDEIRLSSRVARPKLKPTVLVVPLSPHCFALHRGTRQASANVHIDDPGEWRINAVRLMDGTRSCEQIELDLKERFSVSTKEFTAFLDQLVGSGVVTEAEALSFDGLRDDQIERYSRNLNGWAGLSMDGRSPGRLQTELGSGHVLIFGLGGLGSSTALALTMAGCGHLTLVDFDKVELSNLNRQQYSTEEIGLPKVEALQRRLRAHNPDVAITTIKTRLRGTKHAREIIEEVQPDIAVATADRPTIAVDRWINDACFAVGIPYVNTSVSAATGMVFSKVPGSTGCFSCDELWGHDTRPDHHDVRRFREQHDLIPATSAFSFTAMAVGAMIASEVTRYLVRWPMASAGRLVVLDFFSLTTTVTDKPAHPRCTICRYPRPKAWLGAAMPGGAVASTQSTSTASLQCPAEAAEPIRSADRQLARSALLSES
jgi:molybdopterin-synthase adenylyltransferase